MQDWPEEVTAQVEGTKVDHLSPSVKCPSRVGTSSGFQGNTWQGKPSEPCPRGQEMSSLVGDMKADTNQHQELSVSVAGTEST